ncbi:alpha/beta hydrolase [Flavobacteriaceae bacterium F89]|uniref:Alpha/beta hydrolase n=1 Tax=Cerina litoralis TaxID=2874477 RepID=A0AAE3EY73_9FLAO|nr:alpha/beta hydrolase [Cerina litoralis]MCG2462468.1 alpha/beta hydrolase [Cerina litoralis]
MKNLLDKCLPLIYGVYLNSLSLISTKKASEKAFRVLLTPRKGKVGPSQETFLNAAKERRIQIGAITLQAYKWNGEKETILLLHGWESNSFRWHRLIGKLQEENYNIVAFDAPAHGYSSGKLFHVPLFAECTRAVIEIFKPKYIIGHSVGGMTALFSQYNYVESPVVKIVGIGAPSNLSAFMGQFQKKLHLSNKVMQGLDDHFADKYNFDTEEFSLERFAPHLPQQGLLIHDVLDSITPFQGSANIQRNWPNSQLVKTEGLGHSMHQDMVNDHILKFLKA